MEADPVGQMDFITPGIPTGNDVGKTVVHETFRFRSCFLACFSRS